ncbi:hypothetical protein I4U23_011756 [Adineta vaga]|nr:hypothetical protein I4U23_011756 [Adineta vaga]
MDNFQIIRQRLGDLNYFDSKTEDIHMKRNEILSTRIYILLLLIIVILFGLYISLISQTSIITIQRPTQEQIEQLKIKYANKLQCPCKQISISYRRFIEINPRFDEICLSEFVSQKWIDYLFYENTSYYFQLDFRHSASSKFQILRTLCQQAQLTINDSLEQFYSTQFFSNQLIPRNIFDVQIDSFFGLFKLTTESLFRTLLKLIRHTITSNELFSGIEMHFVLQVYSRRYLYIYMDNIYYYQEYEQEKWFDCYCDDFTICELPEGIYSNMNMYDYAGSYWSNNTYVNASTNVINATFSIPGMFASCKHIESLMHSTSECLSDQLCLNQIGSSINFSLIPISSFSVLNQSYLKRNQTMEILANDLFVEDWIISKSYQAYFDQCQPLYCQFIDTEKYTFIYVLTAVISLYGGLRGLLAYFIPVTIAFIRKKKIQSSVTNTVVIVHISRLTRFLMIFRSVRSSIVRLNIFNSYSSDEHIQRNEIIISKIYLIALIICLIGFGTSIYIENQSKTLYIYNPTRLQFEQFKNQSVTDLQCPCSKISNKYSRFLSVNPTYHQICNSVFVSNLWYNSYEIWDIPFPCAYPSFANLASFYFSFLSIFCQTAHQTIYSNLAQIDSTDYVTSEVILENQFNNEMISFIELFQTRLQTSFRGQLSLIQTVIFTNQIISSKATNVLFYVDTVNGTARVDPHLTTHDNCTCGTNPKCHTNITLCSANRLNSIQGMYVGCFMVDSLLISTMECFFNQTCIDVIKSYMINTSELYQQLDILNSSVISTYKTNETIGTLVGNLFIEKWNEFYSYEQYYNQCGPAFCSYTIQQHPDLIYVLAKLIGLYGGLTFLLGFIIPHIVIIFRRKRDQYSSLSLTDRFGSYYQLTKAKLIQMNLFESNRTDEEHVRKELFTTRLYILIFMLILFTLVLYTSLIPKSITVNISLTYLNHYQQLQIKYENTLVCPCNEIVVSYRDFLDLQPSFHEICRSDFISQQWIEYLYDEEYYNNQNYQATASAQFQVLAYLCKLTEETIRIGLIQFYATKLITNEFPSYSLFQNQTDAIVKIFQKSLSQIFKRPFDMTREIIQGNAFMSVYQTNWKFTILKTTNWSPIYTNPITYNHSCSCGTSSKCIESVRINNTIVDGLYIGCYPVDTMLQSSLQCFYNQTCLQMILSYFGEVPENMTFRRLSIKNRFGINEKIEQMVDRLFLDQWFINRSYENYFRKCQPTYCTYSYIQNFDILYIITTILSLYDGLTVLLKFLVPFLIYLIFRISCKRQ